jgi:hypothetical protein
MPTRARGRNSYLPVIAICHRLDLDRPELAAKVASARRIAAEIGMSCMTVKGARKRTGAKKLEQQMLLAEAADKLYADR